MHFMGEVRTILESVVACLEEAERMRCLILEFGEGCRRESSYGDRSKQLSALNGINT
jgi:hypothetical protein